MNNPSVSIIIPVYNVEKYISRCLDSILNQTFQDFEIIVVNDASPDQSRNIAESYAEKDIRITIFDNQENSGAAWSRMVGYSNACGTYLTFCDPDDFLPEEALQLLHNAMIYDMDADICMGEYRRVFADGSKGEIIKNELKYGNDKCSVAKSALNYEIPHFLVNKIYKTQLFNYPIITHKDFSKSSDEFLFFQLLQNCKKIINIDKVVYFYFDNNASASYNKSNFNALNAMIISQKYVEEIYKKNDALESIIEKRKLGKYAKFIQVAGNDKALLQLIFKENIDYLFNPFNLFRHFHKRKAIKVLLSYLKAKYKSVF